MDNTYINLTADNIDEEHICCAIGDKKHACGVDAKKNWIKEHLSHGHVFRKLDARGKIFIEYAPVETAWVPVTGSSYMYIYCLWVAGSFKGKGHGKELLTYCIEDAKTKGKSGVCVLSSKKKKPYLSDKKFFTSFGFEVADSAGEYELLCLSFDDHEKPTFASSAKSEKIDSNALTIFYSSQCPYILHSIDEITGYCSGNGIELETVCVSSLEQAKKLPCVFNNWAVFLKGEFKTLQILNEGSLKKLLES